MTIFWSPRLDPKGITHSVRKAGITVIAGASQKYTLRTYDGVKSSFSMNFNPSAMGWNMPHDCSNRPITGIFNANGGAVRFGPTRSWMKADTLRSTSTA